MMVKKRKRWLLKPSIPPEVQHALHAYGPIMDQLLFNRNITDTDQAEQYLNRSIPEYANSSQLKGITEAVERIKHSIQKAETIIVYGDYDVDGVTATALLVECLGLFGAKVRGYIPNRFEEGYGLNKEALRQIKDDGGDLVITVDCGSRSIEEVEFANSMGLDVIVTDHHRPIDELPQACAFINPKSPDDPYPSKNLAGVGLAYKLAKALAEEIMPDIVDDPKGLIRWLDLVALGTVADLAPLTDENRYMVNQGLSFIQAPYRQGLHALLIIAGVDPINISTESIGYILGPRLNAAGRMDTALDSLDLLLTKDTHLAGSLAQKLDNQNRERQKLTRKLQTLAETIYITDKQDSPIIIAAHAEFSPGVGGLVAARLTEQYYLPSMIATIGEEYTRGSCRSIPEFHITEALDACADILEHHGGHAAAAGFTVKNENTSLLFERMRQISSEKIGNQILMPNLIVDMEIQLSDLNPHLLDKLSGLEPTGQENPPATFITRYAKVKNIRAVGKESAHLKISVTGGKLTYDGIGFNLGFWSEQIPEYVDLLFNFEKNIFNGREYLQMNIKDIKPAGTPD